MNKSKKELLELNDLMLLRSADQSNDDRKATYRKKLQTFGQGKDGERDVWSRALVALSQDKKDEEALRKLYGEIMSLALPAEVLKWWETLFAVVLHAPIEELGRIAAGNQYVPDGVNVNCVGIAAADIAQKVMVEEQECRRKEELKEQKRLKELQRQAENASKSKIQAENDLERHRNSRGNGA